jgi:inner membrane protein
MRIRTHLVFSLFFIFIFSFIINHKIFFFSVALVSSFIPDIDTRFSYFGKYRIFRPLQFFLKHRGILHSGTFLFGILILLSFFLPLGVFPFLVGYGSHLLLDGFTPSGIRIFYPFRKKIRGKIITGGKKEFLFFLFFSILNLFLISFYVLSMF